MHLALTPGPQWFSGADFVIDLVSVVILFLIAVFAWIFYSLNKSRKNHLLFFISLVILGLSFVFKIITYFMLYLTTFDVRIVNVLGQLVYYVEPNTLYFSVAFIIYSVLTLIGFFLLYTIYDSNMSKKTTLLILYFILAVVLFSENAFLFLHLTALLLSGMIALALWKNYRRNKLKSTMQLSLSFFIICLSRIFFILSSKFSYMYVFGEIIQLAGYIILLATFMAVLKNGKKTGKTRDN
jgi:hypothetical protein